MTYTDNCMAILKVPFAQTIKMVLNLMETTKVMARDRLLFTKHPVMVDHRPRHPTMEEEEVVVMEATMRQSMVMPVLHPMVEMVRHLMVEAGLHSITKPVVRCIAEYLIIRLLFTTTSTDRPHQSITASISSPSLMENSENI